MNSQGISILINKFGTVANTARGIAGSISGVAYKFVDGFLTASRPQIVKLYAAGDYNGMNNLVTRTSKFSSYLMGIIGIPLFLEMDYILHLWLGDVPEYTIFFSRLTLIQGLIQAIDFPIGTGIHAVGQMKLPNITSAFIYMIILPISYIAIKMGASPEITYICIICVYPMALLMDLYIINKYTGFPAINFLQKVVLPVIVFVLTTTFTGKIVHSFMEQNFIRLVITTMISSICFISLIYFCGMTNGERAFIKNIIQQKLRLKTSR